VVGNSARPAEWAALVDLPSKLRLTEVRVRARARARARARVKVRVSVRVSVRASVRVRSSPSP